MSPEPSRAATLGTATAQGQHGSVPRDRDSCRAHRARGMGCVGWWFCSPAGGSTGHNVESKLSLQRDTHSPAPWESGLLGKHHNCQTWFFLLYSWACSISPFSNRYQQLSQKVTLPCACSHWLCPDLSPGHNAHFLPRAGLEQSKP